MMMLLRLLVLAWLALSANARRRGNVPHGNHVHWRDLKDDRWEDPQGRIFEVTKSADINALQDELQPGDAMIMAPGDWDGPRIDITANGTDQPGYKIYLIPEIYGETRFVGSCRLNLHGRYQEVRGVWYDGEGEDLVSTAFEFNPGTEHNRLTNSAFTYYNRAEGDEPGKLVYVRLWGFYHIMDWNHFEGKETTGEMVQVRTTQDPVPTERESCCHTFAHNYFGPRPRTASGDDGEGLQIGLFESEHLDYECNVEFNLFDEYDGEIECISVKSSNNTIRYNTFRDSACTITLRHTNNTRVEENYVYCNGKDECGGIRVHGERHVILNNYIEDTRTDDSDNNNFPIGSITIYQGDTTNPYRKIVKNVRIEHNVMPVCTQCLAVGILAPTGGDQVPENIEFIQNVMTGRSDSDFIMKEVDQTNPTFDDNMGFTGIIDNEEDNASGLRREDPEFVYDPDFQIQVPTAANWDFSMTYPPLGKEDVGTLVGTTWYTGQADE